MFFTDENVFLFEVPFFKLDVVLSSKYGNIQITTDKRITFLVLGSVCQAFIFSNGMYVFKKL